MPPTSAAHEDKPAKSPNPKKAIADDFELMLRKSAIPIFCKNKKAMIMKMAMLKATSVGLVFFPLPSSALPCRDFTAAKSENL